MIRTTLKKLKLTTDRNAVTVEYNKNNNNNNDLFYC
jgi:hypothetical protein